MQVRLHCVVESEDPEIIESVCNQLRKLAPHISISPYREQSSLNHCSEFYATLHCSKEEYDVLRAALNNDWDGEEDDCSAYGFNTKMFNPNVYYLQMEAD